MIGSKIIEQKPISMDQVKEMLTERKKEKDLSYEQDLTLAYAKKFAKLTPAQAEKARKDFEAISGLGPELVVKLLDFLPDKKEIIELLLQKEPPVDDAAKQKILELGKKYRK